MTKYHIANHFLHASIRGAERQGHCADSLLENAQIPAGWLDKPEQLISEEQLTRLVKTVWRITEDEFLGLSPLRCKNGTFALMSEFCIGAATLGAVLERSARFYRVVRDDIDIGLQEPVEVDQKRLFFRLQLLDSSLDKDHLLQEFVLLMWQRFCCWLVGQQIPFATTQFSYPAPAHAREYRLMFPGEVLFEQPLCGFSLHPRYLQLPVVKDEEALADFLRESPAYILHRPSQDDSLRTRIRTELAKYEYDRMPGLDALSSTLHMTTRNVCRKLQEEGTTFRKIKASLRREYAIRLLTSEQLSIADVSARVGFAETASFCRAFKRWTGHSPSEWNKVSSRT